MRFTLLAAFLLGTAAGAVAAPAQTVKLVTASATKTTLSVGQTMTMKVTVRLANGAYSTSKPIAWGSSNVTIATVTSTGIVTARAPGNVDIVATVSNVVGRWPISIIPKVASLAACDRGTSTSFLPCQDTTHGFLTSGLVIGDTGKVEPAYQCRTGELTSPLLVIPPCDTTVAPPPARISGDPHIIARNSKIAVDAARLTASTQRTRGASTWNQLLASDTALRRRAKEHPEMAPKYPDLPIGPDNQINPVQLVPIKKP